MKNFDELTAITKIKSRQTYIDIFKNIFPQRLNKKHVAIKLKKNFALTFVSLMTSAVLPDNKMFHQGHVNKRLNVPQKW